MIDDYRFFNEFYDGQIVKKESEKYKLFKLLLVSCVAVIGLFFVLIDLSYIAEFILLVLGMIWNLYLGLNKKLSLAISVVVGMLYLMFTSSFGLYANGLVYVACYIPLQLIATVKDYGEGDHIQIRKKITDYNRILFIIFFLAVTVVLCLFDVNAGSRFVLFDGISAGLLICSALLRNERYLEYYIFRIFALCASIALWIQIAVEFGTHGSLLILIMYAVYLTYDISKCILDHKNYVNEYMISSKEVQKIEDDRLREEKLKVYNNSKNDKK